MAHVHFPGSHATSALAPSHGTSSGRAFSVAFLLNLTFVLVEAGAAWRGHSLSLLADAAHNAGDVLGLALAWGAAHLARRPPSRRRTYGWRRTTILSAVANSFLLLVVVGGVAWEALSRLRTPMPVEGKTMLVVAAIGVVVNAASALALSPGRAHDANVRGAFLHLLADAGVSLGVVVAGAIILRTGWVWLDPAVSLLVSVLILVGTWSLLRESLNLALDAVPAGIDEQDVRAYLARLPNVLDVHDLHIWALSTTEVALTAHLVMPDGACRPRFLHDVGGELQRQFHIAHATLQVEAVEAPEPCRLAPRETT